MINGEENLGCEEVAQEEEKSKIKQKILMKCEKEKKKEGVRGEYAKIYERDEDDVERAEQE